jgi:GDPmannose 4,6-dehydratase
MNIATITGITGQDGSYLAELLLENGYEVHGIVRRTSVLERSRIEHLRSDPAIYNKRLFLHYCDLADSTTFRRILKRTKTTEIYHLAGQSQPGLSFEIPESTVMEVANATLGLLEMVRDMDVPPRVFLAASSEIFGKPDEFPQNESTAFRPMNPYGCAKAFTTHLGRVYRDAHELYICNGIAYNHESPRRGESFVTRKITASAARIARGSNEVLTLGNLGAERDWGYAPEYVIAMWKMLQISEAEDFILATGTQTTVRDFAAAAFSAAGIPIAFEGHGAKEVGRDRTSGKTLLACSEKFFRPVESCRLAGDPTKAACLLGWSPQVTGTQLATIMVSAEMA